MKPSDDSAGIRKLVEQSTSTTDLLERLAASGEPAVQRELDAFTKYVRRQPLTRFIARYELFKQALEVPGSIVEAGVFAGGGLFTCAHVSAILEPVHYARRIIGFDTFEGFPAFTPGKDAHDASGVRSVGGFAYADLGALQQAAQRLDANRFLGEIPKIEFVAGDATVTMPRYVEEHPHLVVALLYLDFDLYQPTRAAIEAFLPRMPKGAVLAFDELNKDKWPGETLAALETVGLHSLRLRRFAFDPLMSYAVIGD